MIDGLVNIIRREVQRMAGLIAQPRIGIVDGYDPVNYRVRVRLQPKNQTTGWIPVIGLWGGDGWGDFAPPTPGDVVKVLFQEGSADAGLCLGRIYSTKTRPLNVPSGERWIVHSSGASVKMLNDGSLVLTDKAGASVLLDGAQKLTATDKAGSTVVMNGDSTGTMTFSGGLTVDGPFTVTGAAKLQSTLAITGGVTGQAGATFSSDVTAGGISLMSHDHTSAAPGSPTSPPLP